MTTTDIIEYSEENPLIVEINGITIKAIKSILRVERRDVSLIGETSHRYEQRKEGYLELTTLRNSPRDIYNFCVLISSIDRKTSHLWVIGNAWLQGRCTETGELYEVNNDKE